MKFRIVERSGLYRVQYKNSMSPFWHTFMETPYPDSITPKEFESFEEAKKFMMREVQALQLRKKKWQEVHVYHE